MPSSPRDSRKNAVLVPPKLSSDLQLCSTVLGQFLRNSDGIFCKVARESWHFGPDQFRWMIALLARQPDRGAELGGPDESAGAALRARLSDELRLRDDQ